MRKRLLSLVLSASLLSAASAPPATADCCDDFWSCLATIATGGLSCKAQQIAAAIEGTKKLIAAVEATRSGFSKTSDDTVEKIKNDVSSAGGSMKGDLQKSLDEIKKAESDTELLVRPKTMQLSPHAGAVGAGAAAMAPAGARGPSGATAPAGSSAQGSMAVKGSSSANAGSAAVAGGATGGATMPYTPPADPARVEADLKRALEWVQAARNDAETKQAPMVRAKANEAGQEVQKNEPPARKIVGDQLLNPLGVVRKSLEDILVKILNPFDMSSVTKFVDAEIKRIQGRAPTAFDMMGKQLSSDAESRLMAGQRPLDDVRKQAADTKKAADLAKRLAESGKKSDLDKLEELIGAPPSSMAMLAPGGAAKAPAGSSIASAAVLKSRGTMKAARVRAQNLSAGLASQWDATRKLLAVEPVPITPAMQKLVSDDLTKRFAGKSYPDARKAQQQLLDEAQVKFANDPKTLAAVERYLQAQTSPMLSTASAPVRR